MNVGINLCQPKVSVIIPTYNCAKYVSKALESVLEQTYKDYEIIVVDDGSTDNLKIVMEKYLTYSNVRYIYQVNKGLAAARNTGICNAKGEYIAFLDADDSWVNSKLDAQLKLFEADKDVELIHGNTFYYVEGHEENINKYRMNIDYNRLTKYEIFNKILLFQADIVLPTIIVKKSVFEKVGYFDEKLSYLGCEDREFCLRVFRECKTYYLDEYLAYYLIRSNSMSKNTEKMRLARQYTIEKIVETSNFIKNKKRTKQNVYSQLYLRTGLSHFRTGNRKEAIKELSISFCYNCINLKSLVYLVLSLVPVKIIEDVRIIRSKYVKRSNNLVIY